MTDEPMAYSIEGAARQLEVSNNTIFRYIKQGRLQSWKLTPTRTGRIRISRDELERFVAARKAESQR